MNHLLKHTYISPGITVLGCECSNRYCFSVTSETNDIFNLRFQFRCTQFASVRVSERNNEELVFPDEDNVIVLGRIKLSRRVGRFSRIPGRMETIAETETS